MPDCDTPFWPQLRYDARKWFYVLWHQFSLSPPSFGTIFNFALNTSIVALPLGIAYKNGKPYALHFFGIYLLMILLKRKRDFSPAASRKLWKLS